MASANVLTITNANFDEEVLKSPTPVLLDFWAPWCGPCRMISPVVDEIADAKAGTVKVGKVNVDDEQNLAMRFRVNSIPALLFFKNGEVVDQVVGAVPKAALVAKLDALV
ncbi:thioredoxin [Verrucomicrobiota bacterium sgz303538]